MTSERDSATRDVAVFLLLVAIGTLGRLAQPLWAFTPLAAVTIFAGYYFARWQIAALVPVACLAASDQWLPAHDETGVLLATYVAMILPVWLGRGLRAPAGRSAWLVRYVACGLLPATVFFVSTNFAVWALKSTYDKTLAGIVECYVAAIPFYRWMLAGDVCYVSVLFACLALAGALSAQEHARQIAGRDRG